MIGCCSVPTLPMTAGYGWPIARNTSAALWLFSVGFFSSSDKGGFSTLPDEVLTGSTTDFPGFAAGIESGINGHGSVLHQRVDEVGHDGAS